MPAKGIIMADDYTDSADSQEEKRLEEVCNMGHYIEKIFRAAEDHKRESGIEDELLECLRQSRSEYNQHDLEIINKTNQPVIYFPLSDMKRRTANAWCSEIFLYSADPPWRMRATPVPDISGDDAEQIASETMSDFIEYSMMNYMENGVPVAQARRLVFENPPDPDVVAKYAMMKRDEIDNKRKEEADIKVKRMSKLCHDQQIQGRWMNAMADVVDCASTYGTGILKGPLRRIKRLPVFNKTNGVDLKDTEVYEWESINPFDAYPSKGAVDINDGDFCQFVSYTPKELNSMKNLGDEYFKSNINEILSLFPNGGYKMWRSIDSEKQRLENDGTAESTNSTLIDGIEFWGDMRGSLLKMHGITEYNGTDIEETNFYEVNAIVIMNRLIFCSITDERLGRPLFKGTFFKTQGSWWGDSPMKKMRDVQRECNASMRSLCHNMAQASGPMGFISDQSRILPGYDYRLTPWSVTAFSDKMRMGRNPMTLFQAASNAAEFRTIRDKSIKDADIVTGIPAYSHGSDIAAGAGRTSSGLAMLMGAATRGMKHVVNSLSYDVLVPALTYQYRVNLIESDDPAIKGDANVDVGGVLAILVKDQNFQRVANFLNLANNPNVAAVMGKSGIAELLRVYTGLLEGINPDNVVPSKSDIEKTERMDRIMQMMRSAEAQGMQIGGMAQGAVSGPMSGINNAGVRAPLSQEPEPLPPPASPPPQAQRPQPTMLIAE